MASFKFNSNAIQRQAAARAAVGLYRAALVIQSAVQAKLNQQASRRGANPSSPGSPPAKDTGTLARSILIDRTGLVGDRPIVRIGTKLRYARIHEFGGTITARKAMLIPLNQESRDFLRAGNSVRSLPGGWVNKKNGVLHIPFSKGKGKRARSGEYVFSLRKSVRMPARPYFRPGIRESLSRARDELRVALLATPKGGR